MSRYRFILPLLLLSAFLILLPACQAAKVESAREGTAEGEKILDFTLKDLKENSFTLSSFFGEKILLLDFSTTWCPHCVTIIPALKNIHANEDVKVLAVYIKESRATVESFTTKHQIPYPVLLDTDGSVASKYDIRGVPTVMVVDKTGIIRFRGHHIPEDLIKDIVKE